MEYVRAQLGCLVEQSVLDTYYTLCWQASMDTVMHVDHGRTLPQEPLYTPQHIRSIVVIQRRDCLVQK